MGRTERATVDAEYGYWETTGVEVARDRGYLMPMMMIDRHPVRERQYWKDGPEYYGPRPELWADSASLWARFWGPLQRVLDNWHSKRG